MKVCDGVVFAAAMLVAGFVSADNQTLDLQSSTANVPSASVTFAGAGPHTLTLQNAQAGENVVWPKIVASTEDAAVTIAVDGAGDRTLRLANHVVVNGALGADVPVLLGTNITVKALTNLTSVVAPFPAFDVKSLASGTSVTIDRAVQLPRLASGVAVASTAILALTGDGVLDGVSGVKGTEGDPSTTVYTLGDYDVMLVNTNAFERNATVKVAAGRMLALYPADVSASFAWTEPAASTVDLSFVLGTAQSPSLLDLLTTKSKASVTIRGTVSGYGDVVASQMSKNAVTVSFTFSGLASHVGVLRSRKVINNTFSMRVPNGTHTLPYTLDLASNSSITFPPVTDNAESTLTIADLYFGYYNTTLDIKKNQSVIVQNARSGTGWNVTGWSAEKSFFTVEHCANPSKPWRFYKVTYTLDADSLSYNNCYLFDYSGERHWYMGSSLSSPHNLSTLYNGSILNGAVVLAGKTMSFTKMPAKATLDVLAGATASLSVATSGVVNVSSGATLNLSNVSDPLSATAKPKKLTVNAAAGSSVNVLVDVTGGEIVATDATVNFERDLQSPIEIKGQGATVNCGLETAAWTNGVALWLDASKTESLGALTNNSGVVQYQSRSQSSGLSPTNCVADAWWWDCRGKDRKYFLYNNRCYEKATFDDCTYVNPWWQPEGGPANGPCVSFGPVEQYMSRLDVYETAVGQGARKTIPAKSVLMVYGASTLPKYRGGTSLVSDSSYQFNRGLAKTAATGDFEKPMTANSAKGFAVRKDGAAATPTAETSFTAPESPATTKWQILWLDTKNVDIFCIGRGTDSVGGGQIYAEILFFTNELSQAQQIAAERYLATKWGLLEQYVGGETTVQPHVGGTGTIAAGLDVNVDLANARDFRGTANLDGGTLTMPTGRAVPEVGDIPRAGQVAWFDPSATNTVALAEITAENLAEFPGSEQTNEVVNVFDRLAARRSNATNLVMCSSRNIDHIHTGSNRRPYLSQTAYGYGGTMPWIDCNNYYQDIKITTSDTGVTTNLSQIGNAVRFWGLGERRTAQDSENRPLDMAHFFLVQNSMRGGGTPMGDDFTPSAPYSRSASSATVSAPLWKSGVSAALSGGTVRVNGTAVADPLTSSGFTGGPEVLTIQTATGTTFPAKSVGYYGNSEGTSTNGEIFAEMIVYGADAVMSETQRGDIEAYLARKWFGTVLPGYVSAASVTLAGTTAYTASSQRTVLRTAADYEGTVTLSDAAWSFVLDGEEPSDNKVVSGAFEVAGGTLALPASVTVDINVLARLRPGSYKLAGWHQLKDATSFTLQDGAVRGNPGAGNYLLRQAADGLYLDVHSLGFQLFFR